MNIYFNGNFEIVKREDEAYYKGSENHNQINVFFPKITYDNYIYIYPVFSVKRADGRSFGEFALTNFTTAGKEYIEWSDVLPDKALEVEGTLEITILFRYSIDGKYSKVSTGKVLLNVKDAVVSESDIIYIGEGTAYLSEINAIRSEFGARVDDLEINYISNLNELDSFTTAGIYKININNYSVFHLFVTTFEDGRINQVRSSNNGYIVRNYIPENGWEVWKAFNYNIDGYMPYSEFTIYQKSAIVIYHGDNYLSLIGNNTSSIEDINAWLKLDFNNYVKKNELDNKVDKKEGYGLSTNDFTNAYKEKVDKSISNDNVKTINGQSIVGKGNIEIKGGGTSVDLSEYVKKEEGKGLSTNDLTNELLAKLNSLKNYDDTNLQNQIDGIKKVLTSNDVDYDTLQELVDALKNNVSNIDDIFTELSKKVDKNNLKTINGESLIGTGNIEDKVFPCVYGATTYDEVTNAISAGKLPYCIYNSNQLYIYNGVSGDYYIFTRINGVTYSTLQLNSNNVWNKAGNVSYEQLGHKKTSLSSSSTDTEYPSSKAVVTYVNEAIETAIGNALEGDY